MKEKIALVGNTGFVGSNLCNSYEFDWALNSKNVQELYDEEPDVLIYAGVTGTKWFANQYPDSDDKVMQGAKLNIEKIRPKEIVLISTVDIYNPIAGVDEDTIIRSELLHTYGKNRFLLEEWVKENFNNYHIIRLPAIYGANLKKNFVYDMIHMIPKILNVEMMEEVLEEVPDAKSFYKINSNGNYELKQCNKSEYLKLRERFLSSAINAMIFTNSDSEYQFYNLKNLWNHIQLFRESKITAVNIVTEPISAKEIYKTVYGKEFYNNRPTQINYNIESKYASDLAGLDKYFYDKSTILQDLKNYIKMSINELF